MLIIGVENSFLVNELVKMSKKFCSMRKVVLKEYGIVQCKQWSGMEQKGNVHPELTLLSKFVNCCCKLPEFHIQNVSMLKDVAQKYY